MEAIIISKPTYEAKFKLARQYLKTEKFGILKKGISMEASEFVNEMFERAFRGLNRLEDSLKEE